MTVTPLNDFKVIEGCRLPSDRPLTENERAWVGFIRLVTCEGDPPPTLARVQALRVMLAT
ncbi:MAG: hypothetical protein GC186_00135 [Rhodobacteraceae bacterium]|nr:hypothetical protein [Paracoccaceae bacterium]